MPSISGRIGFTLIKHGIPYISVEGRLTKNLSRIEIMPPFKGAVEAMTGSCMN